MGKYALLLVLAMVFGLITYGHVLRNNLWRAEAQLVSDYSINQSKNIAQSVAMLAVRKISDPNDEDFSAGEDETIQFPSTGSGFVNWDDMSGAYRLHIYNSGDSLLQVTSTGRFDESEYEVSVLLQKEPPIFNPDLTYGVFSGEGITLGGSASISGNAGTNGAAILPGNYPVNLSWPGTISGALAIGPGGIVISTVNRPWNVGGGVENLPAVLNYELPLFPDYPPKNTVGASIQLSGNNSTSLNVSEFNNVYLPEIRIQGNNTLTVETGGEDVTIHVGNLDVKQGHINFEGGGNVTFKVENNITLNGSSSINNNNNVESMFTYYKGDNDINFAGATKFNSGLFAESADVTLSGSGGFTGNIITGGDNVTLSGASQAHSRLFYAPNATFKMTGSSSVRGAIVAKSFEATGASRVIFENELDSELPDMEFGDSSFSLLSWY